MKYSISQRQQRAEQLHNQGYNCAQCVMMVFDDVTGLDENIAQRVLASFGAGMGSTKEVCGTLSAAAALRGMINYKSPADKSSIYRMTAEFNDRFEKSNGSTRCCELKRAGKPCSQLIKDVVEMIANDLESTY